MSGRDRSKPSLESGALSLVGVRHASTFRGFCGLHDNAVFREAEIAKETTARAAFLLSYRALAYELYMKMVALPTVLFFRDHLDAGKPFEEQAGIQDYLSKIIYTTTLGRDEHARLKIRWDEMLTSNDLDDFKWAHIIFDRTLPVVTSGSFFPEYDFAGRPLQALDAPIGALGLLSFQLVNIAGRSHAIFGWVDRKSVNTRFTDSFLSLNHELMASAIVQFCFETSDNIFVKPSWWASLEPAVQRSLSHSLKESTPGDRSPSGLIPKFDKLFYAEAHPSPIQ